MTNKMPAIRALLLSESVGRSRVADTEPFGDDDIGPSYGRWRVGTQPPSKPGPVVW
jgi:hypothetical protein